MARFCKFRGKAGVLVAHPLALDADPPRYAGQARIALSAEVLDAAKGIDDRRHSERYEPCDDVLPLDWHLEKAAQKGDGVIVDRCDAKNMADAVAKFAAKAKPADAPKKSASHSHSPLASEIK